MADLLYRLSRADIFEGAVGADYARELFEQAAARPEADLDGDLVNGFHFWTTSPDGLHVTRCHVIPVFPAELWDEQPSL